MKSAIKNLLYKICHGDSGDDDMDCSGDTMEPSSGRSPCNKQDELEHAVSVISACIDSGCWEDVEERLSDFGSKGELACSPCRFVRRSALVTAVVALLMVFLYSVAVFIGFATAVLSGAAFSYGVGIALVAGAGALTNVLLVVYEVLCVKRWNRLASHLFILRLRGYASVEELSAAAGKTGRVITRDLEYAVRQKIVPWGQFNADKSIFMYSSEVIEAYRSEPKAVEHLLVVSHDKPDKDCALSESNSVDRADVSSLSKIDSVLSLTKRSDLARTVAEIKDFLLLLVRETGQSAERADVAKRFLAVCGPTVERMIDAYMDSEQRRSVGEDVSSKRVNIAAALKASLFAFENIFAKLQGELNGRMLDSLLGESMIA